MFLSIRDKHTDLAIIYNVIEDFGEFDEKWHQTLTKVFSLALNDCDKSMRKVSHRQKHMNKISKYSREQFLEFWGQSYKAQK